MNAQAWRACNVLAAPSRFGRWYVHGCVCMVTVRKHPNVHAAPVVADREEYRDKDVESGGERVLKRQDI